MTLALTPSGAYFPGLLGETLASYVARSVASFQACMDRGTIALDIDLGGSGETQRQYPELGSTS